MAGPSGWSRLWKGLSRTRESFRRLLSAGNDVELEELLLSSDVGVKASRMLTEKVMSSPDRRVALEREIADILRVGVPGPQGSGAQLSGHDTTAALNNLAAGTLGASPMVIMIVGVNGSGKTTTVGKLCHHYAAQGRKVVVAAADTYRDAASEQLSVWTGRARVEVVSSDRGQDAAAVAYDAIARARSREMDIVLIDTAGRLHTRKDLMAEAEKISRVCAKARPGAPDERWIVIDATVGQNGLRQAQAFHELLNLTGVIVTKLDGTAKGGILIPIALELGIPIRFIGTGESLEDLEPFDACAYASALLAPDR